MIDALALAVTVACIGAAIVVAVQALAGTFRWTRVAPTLVLVEAVLLVQAVLDVVGLARGHRPGEPGPHLAYLVISVLVVPAVALQVRGDDDRWAGVLVASALVVVAVLVVRMTTTWRGGT